MYTPDREVNPPHSYFENDSNDYDVYRCNRCADNFSSGIYFDHLTNENICENDLSQPDLQIELGFTDREFLKYQTKVRKQLPSNPL